MNQTAETTHPDRINGNTGPVRDDEKPGADWSNNDTNNSDQEYLKLRHWWTAETEDANGEPTEEEPADTEDNETPKPKKQRKGLLRRRGKKQSPQRAANGTEDGDDQDDQPQTGDTVDRLAVLGRSGKRIARQLLATKARLELSDEQRADAAKAAEAKFRARREAIERAASPLVYVLAVGSAVTGQVTGLVAELLHRLHVGWATLAEPALTSDYMLTASRAAAALAAAFAAALLVEGTGLAFASAFKRARVLGRRGLVPRIAMWAAAGTACGMNAVLHWDSAWAYPTALGSIVALLVFELETQLESFDALQETADRLRRERAEQTLIYRAVKAARGRRVARLMVASLTADQRQQLVTDTVQPEAVTADALTAYMAVRPTDLLRRWWSALQWDRTAKRADRKADRSGRKRTDKQSGKQTGPAVEQTTQTSPVPAPDQTTRELVRSEQASPQPSDQTTVPNQDQDQTGPAAPKSTSPVRSVRRADLDAAELADRYPKGLPLNKKGDPARNLIADQMGWGSGKTSNAIAAYADRRSA